MQLGNLRKLNLFAVCLHLASSTAILVWATYLTQAPGAGNFSDPQLAWRVFAGTLAA